jgi:hypothetical protein
MFPKYEFNGYTFTLQVTTPHYQYVVLFHAQLTGYLLFVVSQLYRAVVFAVLAAVANATV